MSVVSVLTMGERNVEEDYDFYYIQGLYTEIFWIVGVMWKQWAFYILAFIINSKSGLKQAH